MNTEYFEIYNFNSINYDNKNINETFGMAGTVSKVVGDTASKVGTIIVKNPKTSLLVGGAAGVGLYAGINNKPIGDVVNDAGHEVGKFTGDVVGNVAGGVFKGITGGGGIIEGINAMIASATGIPVEYIPYIWYGLLGLFFLLMTWKIYKWFT